MTNYENTRGACQAEGFGLSLALASIVAHSVKTIDGLPWFDNLAARSSLLPPRLTVLNGFGDVRRADSVIHG